jgi:phosphatidylglycerophosphatase A
MYKKNNRYGYYVRPFLHAKNAAIEVPLTFYTLVATWFFIGRIRFAPGTVGSIASYPIFYLMIEGSTTRYELQLSLLVCILILTILGTWAISRFQKVTKTFDHSSIVIDEVIGTLLTIAISYNWLAEIVRWMIPFLQLDLTIRDGIFLLGMLVFRYYDIRKPLIIGYIDRMFKNAFMVILDDIFAALFASGVIFIGFIIIQKFG